MSEAKLNSPEGTPDSGYGINIQNVWQQLDPETKKEVFAFWLSEGLLIPDEIAEERASQILMIGRDSDGKIAGICTAYLTYIPNLINKFYYYRSYIAEKHRTHGLAIEMIKHSRRFLNQQFQEGKDTQAIGVFLEIENDQLKKRNQAVWESGEGWNFYFIGVDQKGSHLRVSYFENTYIL
jgi:hypothetical protein